MKRIFITGFCLLMVCASVMATPITKDLNEGNNLTLNLELDFPDGSNLKGEFISWELVGAWDKFDYDFSQGIVEDNKFTIKADEYKDFVGAQDGIALTIAGKSKTKEDTYNLLMKVSEVSDGLSISKETLNLNLNINYFPAPLWKRMLVPSIILLVLALIIWVVFKETAKFPRGLLQLGSDEVNLKGKSRVSVKEELSKLGVYLEDDCDIVFVKKRFGRFQGPCIKEMRNCALEREGIFVSKGMILLPEEELCGLKDIDGNEIIIRYC